MTVARRHSKSRGGLAAATLVLALGAAGASAGPLRPPPQMAPPALVQVDAQYGDASDDADFLFRLGMLEGHLMVGHELIKAHQPALALPHFGHPVRELYDDIADFLNQNHFPPFDAQLAKLEASVAVAPDSPDTEAQYQAAIATVHRARDLAPAEVRDNVPEMIKMCSNVVDAASGEFGEALERGRIAVIVEYHDSRGYLEYVAQQIADIGKAHPDAATQSLVERFQGVLAKAQWIVGDLLPGPVPRASVATYRDIAAEAAGLAGPTQAPATAAKRMIAPSLRPVLATLLVGAAAAPAWAQRAVETPSAALGAPAAPTPPPPGIAQAPFVYGGELETSFLGEVAKPAQGDAKTALYNASNVDLYGNYRSWLSLYATFHLEQNRGDNDEENYPDSNKLLQSEGLTMRQAFVTVRPTSDLALYGGKIHPAFGSAWDLEPGPFSTFASDYEQDERIGLGAEYAVLKAVGIPNLRLSFETFFLDTSALSYSLLSMPALGDPTADRPFRYTHAQFGPSNTESLSSFTVAARGGQEERGLTYQLSFTREATDAPGGKMETGESIGAMYDPTGDGMPIAERLGVTPFLEYTHFDNFANTAGLERHYVVGGLTFTRVRWQYVVAGGLRESSGASHDHDSQLNLSINYTVTPELSVGGGVNYIVEAGRDSFGAGPFLTYHRAF